MASSLMRPLLVESKHEGSGVMPAAQKLLQLAYSEDVDRQLEAVMGISKLIDRHPVNASTFGPLCHTLSRLVASDERAVVAYAARGIKVLVLDDALRPQATVAGIQSVLSAALTEWEDDAPCLREILGALQTLCCDKSTVLGVVDAGAVGPVLELLDASDLELRILSTAIAANILAFSDTLLLTNEACIDLFSDSLEDVLASTKSGIGQIRDYGLAAIANACAHPVLAGRAKELGALEYLRFFTEERLPVTASNVLLRDNRTLKVEMGRRQRAATAVARMNGAGLGEGDVEEGGTAGAGSLHFYTFKWGVRPSLEIGLSIGPCRARVVVALVMWLVVIVFVIVPGLGLL